MFPGMVVSLLEVRMRVCRFGIPLKANSSSLCCFDTDVKILEKKIENNPLDLPDYREGYSLKRLSKEDSSLYML